MSRKGVGANPFGPMLSNRKLRRLAEQGKGTAQILYNVGVRPFEQEQQLVYNAKLIGGKSK
jgi:hypothetical protein